MKSQYQMYREAEQRLFDQNRLFMELINHPTNPLTNADLIALIKRRPTVYGRFAGYIGKLKD